MGEIATYLSNKVRNVVRGIKQDWGTARIKRALWNKEFAEGRWDFTENTADDPVYQYLVKYCKNGSVLDLGCGSGNTGCELDESAYHDYTGVDISDVAIKKAKRRSEVNRRSEKNQYHQSDIITYVPNRMYDVILLRESIAYIPRYKVKSVLARYSHYLKEDGVFIISWYDSEDSKAILERAENGCKLLEKFRANGSRRFLVVLQAKFQRVYKAKILGDFLDGIFAISTSFLDQMTDSSAILSYIL